MHSGIEKVRIDTRGIEQDPEAFMREVGTDHIERKFLDIPYGGQSRAQELDLYLPGEGAGPFPVIIHIHGGAFCMGDKRDPQVEPFLPAVDRGYAVASINYRMSGEKTFPAAILDCKGAVRWLRANAGRYLLDGDRFAVVGGSAGGNLAAMVAASSAARELEDRTPGDPGVPTCVQACVDWFGPTDFLRMDAQLYQLGLGHLGHADEDSPESLYLGGQITKLDPARVQEANPISYIDETLPPTLIQHGELDHIVCVLQSELFYQAVLERLGPGRAALDIIEGAGHGDVHFSMPENMERVFGFLDEVFGL